jgi:hypothetical protein
MMKKSIYIVTSNDVEKRFQGAYSSLGAAVKGAKTMILAFSHEAWLNFVDIRKDEDGKVKAIVNGTAVIESMGEPAEWYEFDYEVREVEVQD